MGEALGDATFAERYAVYDVFSSLGWCLRHARLLLQVEAGLERRPAKSSPALVAESRRRLRARLAVLPRQLRL
jgi:hypothetical protein